MLQSLQNISLEKKPKELHDSVRILNHTYVVDRIFQANLIQESHGYKATNTTETPSLQDLNKSISTLDEWYLQYVKNISNGDLNKKIDFQFTDEKPGHMTRSEILLHIINHGSYHRGAVGRILFQISSPVPKDTLTGFLHSPRNLDLD